MPGTKQTLAGKRALVCGSSRGIGRACAELLARDGASVTLVARDESRLREVGMGLIADAAQRHDHLAVDFADPSRLAELVTAHIQQTGGYQILLNNTGGPPAGPITDATPDDFANALSRHLVCNHLLVQALLPSMTKAGYGRIINIISISVKAPIPNLGVSNTTRGAVANWAKTLAGELGPLGITVNNVLPGYTATERLAELLEWQAHRLGIAAEELAARMKLEVPARRFAQPHEIAEAVAFLASPAAAYINGINLPVDGGRLPTL